jgi:peptide/nickel transport system substrate-binding protein
MPGGLVARQEEASLRQEAAQPTKGSKQMKRMHWASGVALVALTATACGTGDDTASGTSSGGSGGGGGGDKIVYAEQFQPAAAWATETNDAFTLTRAGCLEALVRYEADGSLSPALATEWEQVKPTVWEFTLREGAEFQDGTPLNSDAVVGALNHVLEATAPARAFNPDVVAGVKAKGDTAVQITTPAPDVLMPLRMASPNTGILAPAAYSGDQIKIEGTCTGPFTVVKETPRQSLALERNDSYWGEKAQVAEAEVRFVADGAARVSQLQAGEVHIASSVPAASRATVEGDTNVEVQELQAPRTTTLILNNSRPPFDDPLVRQAVQSAIDTETIATAIYEGGASPAIGPFSPDDPWAPDAEPVAFDQDEATRLFEEAGVDPGSLSIEIVAYNDRPEFGDLAAVLQDQLGQVGMDVKIKAGEYAALEPDLLAGNFDAALLSRGYLVDIADPAGFLLSDYTCEGGYNLAQYCDPEVDAMIKEAAANEDVDARYAAYAEIAEKLQADAASAFLVHEALLTATQADVENYELHPLAYYVLTPEISLGGS